MSTLIELRTQLSEDYTRDPNNRVWTSNAVDRALNKWYSRVQKDLWWSTMISQQSTTFDTVSWVWETALPSNFVSVVRVVYNDTILQATTKKDVAIQNSQNTTPYYYYLYQNNIVLYPTPNKVYSIELIYDADLSKLTTSQGSVLPETVDDAICVYAAYKLFQGTRDPNAWSFYQEYQDQMNTVRMQLQYIDQNEVFSYSNDTNISISPYAEGYNRSRRI